MGRSTTRDEADAIERVLELCDARAGDDAAVIASAGGMTCVSTDSTIDGVHAPAGTPTHALGRWAAARAISDLAAMGALPLAMTCAVHVPNGAWDDAVSALEGVAARGHEQGMPLVGGDLCSTGGPLALVVTVIGRRGAARPGFVMRSGARAGDVIVVTGQLGAVAVALRAGAVDLSEPPDRLRAGSALAPFATAMLDISDGLARDAAAIAAASNVVLEIDLDLVPCAPGAQSDVAASFGDDYELLACIDPARISLATSALGAADSNVSLTKIGVVVDGGRVARFVRGGSPTSVPVGFTHR